MKILLALAHPAFFRNFEPVVDVLLERGHLVHVRFCREHKSLPPQRFALLRSPPPGLHWTQGDDRIDEGHDSRSEIRAWRDVLQYLRPEFRRSRVSWERLESNYKGTLPSWALHQGPVHRIASRSVLRRRLAGIAAAADRAVAPSRWATEFLERESPDLVLASPAVTFKNAEVEYLDAARRLGIATAVPVASWDNLTNKGVLKVVPDAMIVWNEAMQREAVHLHDVAPDRIDVVGAPLFDEWFRRRPSTTREAFLIARGLDPARPTILYTCSSFSIAGPQEFKTIIAWRTAVRDAGIDANVLVRPHPMAIAGWETDRGQAAIAGGLVVWPTAPRHPTDEASRDEFFDSLAHADVVVGLNTSAMIEAAILGRPVLCFRDARRAKHQTGTLHFQHLLQGDFLDYDRDLPGHVARLRSVLEEDQAAAAAAARCRRFVEAFVRPGGLDRTAAPMMVDAIERRFGASVNSYTEA